MKICPICNGEIKPWDSIDCGFCHSENEVTLIKWLYGKFLMLCDDVKQYFYWRTK
jgi:hypothetical protein